jgi:hypothetical protein
MTELFRITTEPTITFSPILDTSRCFGVGSSKSCSVEGGRETEKGITGILDESRISILGMLWSDDSVVLDVAIL